MYLKNFELRTMVAEPKYLEKRRKRRKKYSDDEVNNYLLFIIYIIHFK